MSDRSPIEWTDATWNPVTGCVKVSPGCDHCYAETFAERFRGVPGHHFERGFDLQLRPQRLDQPLRWARPRRIFVNSMSDLFHQDVPDDFIAQTFAVMMMTAQHTYQVLTKRHGRMRSLLSNDEFRVTVVGLADSMATSAATNWLLDRWPLPNVWLGVSVEDQKRADLRIPALLDTPAAVRWISAEPLLGPVDLTDVGFRPPADIWHEHPWLARGGGSVIHDPDCARLGECLCDLDGSPGLDWVVVGGESGPGARPMEWDWARRLRDQCSAAGVAFLMKQAGTVAAGGRGKGGDPAGWPEPFPRQYPAVGNPAVRTVVPA